MMRISVYVVSLLVFMSISMSVQSKEKSEIYQWKDTSGVTHFTDDPMQVPAKFKKTSKRGVKPLPTIPALKKNHTMKNGLSSDKIWMSKCARCHTVGVKVAGKVDLSSLAINSMTKLPQKVAAMLPRMRMATDGRLSDMPKVKVSSDELQEIAEYLLSKMVK